METRLRPGDVGCELWNDTIAPLGRFQLAANNISNSPVETDHDGVDRLKRLLARRLDELDNLGCDLIWRAHKRPRLNSRAFSKSASLATYTQLYRLLSRRLHSVSVPPL
jgi:hypothetical protein